MKKVLSAILVCIVLLPCLTAFASATGGDLPFDLVAPAYVSAKWAEGGDSPTTTNLAYSLSNDMTTFFKNKETAHLDDTIGQFMFSPKPSINGLASPYISSIPAPAAASITAA